MKDPRSAKVFLIHFSGTVVGILLHATFTHFCRERRKKIKSSEFQIIKLDLKPWPKKIPTFADDVVFDWNLDVRSLDLDDLLHYSEFILRLHQPSGTLKISQKLKSFLLTARDQYNKEIPFHNFHHGFSCMHTTYLVLRKGALEDHIGHLKTFAICLAALCHDIGHPGRSNDFLVRSNHTIALDHNDDAVLERFHSRKVFKILEDPDCNVFEGLSRVEYTAARKTIIDAILSTDMGAHKAHIAALQERDPADPWGKLGDPESMQAGVIALTRTVVHCADLVGQALPWHLASRWGNAALQEFQAQAEEEEARGLPITPHMQGLSEEGVRSKVQKGFLTFVVLPLWCAFSRLVPETKVFVDNLNQNILKYDEQLSLTVGGC